MEKLAKKISTCEIIILNFRKKQKGEKTVIDRLNVQKKIDSFKDVIVSELSIETPQKTIDNLLSL